VRWIVAVERAAIGTAFAAAAAACWTSPGSPASEQPSVASEPTPLVSVAQEPSTPVREEPCRYIRRVSVSSSALRSVGYCSSKEILEVQFVRGAVYRYYDVPARFYRDLMGAPSHGRYFNHVFKPAGFRYERVR
jgi:hypothetical protein